MTPVYLFCAAVGVPLLAWFAFIGDADADGFGETGTDGSLIAISLSTMAFIVGFFGLAGLLLESTGASAITALLAAIASGVGAGVLSSKVMKWVRVSGASSDVSDASLNGVVAKVSLPISAEHRGKIILTKGGAREQMTAAPADGSLIDAGQDVVIIGIERGVAVVAPIPDIPAVES